MEVSSESGWLPRRRRPASCSRGFTLSELLIATAILLIVILVLFQVIAGMTSIWHKSSGDVSNFEAARSAFTTLNEELSRATLRTYSDYINDPSVNNSPFGQFRTSLPPSQQAGFVPFTYARASELHFICGPSPQVIPSGATAANNPGDAVFFQAPLGVVASASTDKYLQSSLNDVGFYIQYSDLAASSFPSWLTSFFGGQAHYRYRLVECVEPTESLSIYQNETATGTYTLNWIPKASASSFPVAGASYNESVLAEDVVLLLIRPRLEPVDEQILAPKFSVTYGPTTQNSIISPNYVYDSRSWQSGYNYSPTSVNSKPYALYMRNQLPPILDVAMVCVDSSSFIRLQASAQPMPPAVLQAPSTLFTNSANMDADLTTYGQQLTANHIRFKTFRSSVQMQTAAWINE